MRATLSQEMFDHFCRVLDDVVDYVNSWPRIGVAVSGGVDSVTLLHLARRYGSLRNRPIVALHVNHGLRENAQDDEAFVRELCSAWGVQFQGTSVNLEQISPPLRRGVESDARVLRYQALRAEAYRYECGQVLLGHHAMDQVETVLWRLFRGASTTGMGGIRARVMRDGMLWVRPLLTTDKASIQRYTVECRLPSREDETNQDVEYDRNYIRHRVVPAILERFPHVEKTVGPLTEVLQSEDAWMDEEANRVLASVASVQKGVWRVDIAQLEKCPIPLQRRAIKLILYCLTSGDWSFTHVESVLRLSRSTSPSARLDLPEGVVARREYGWLCLHTASETPAELEPNPTGPIFWSLSDGVHVKTAFGDVEWHFACRSWKTSDGIRSPSLYEFRCTCMSAVEIRSARLGDRITLYGSGGTKKLQDVFTDAKVPSRLRWQWPVFVHQGEILWLPGLVRGNSYPLCEGTQSAWVISVTQDPFANHGRSQTKV